MRRKKASVMTVQESLELRDSAPWYFDKDLDAALDRLAREADEITEIDNIHHRALAIKRLEGVVVGAKKCISMAKRSSETAALYHIGRNR